MNRGVSADEATVIEPAVILPGLGELEKRHASTGPARKAVRKLLRPLWQLSATQDRIERAEALHALLRWLLHGPAVPGSGAALDPRTARLELLVSVLSADPALRAAASTAISSLGAQASALRLLCATGLPSRSGFASELAARIAAAIVPEVQTHDLIQPLLWAFERPDDVDWLESLSSAQADAAASVLLDGRARGALESGRRRAVAHVATRVAALGIAPDVLMRTDGADDPFLRLARLLPAEGPGEISTEAKMKIVSECRDACQRVLEHLEEYGVSTDLVFRLECIAQGLDRIEALLQFERRGIVSLGASGASLLADVMRAEARQRSPFDVVRTSTQQLARKIVERAGHTGEHYITRTAREWARMLASAAGGGVLTSVTTVLKYKIGWLALPLFFEGLFQSANYALSFLVMQVLGFTLATKQPSVTAAALAASLKERTAGRGFGPVVEMVARITRSQLAAVMGNLGLVIPAAAALHAAILMIRGTTVLDAYAAQYVVRSLDPVHGPTAIFAALTGVFLWFSSGAAGWAENWVVYHRIHEAIASHRVLRSILGEQRARALGERVVRVASGVAGNVSLGLTLGMSPLVARFFGLPLDVRHVTLSTGALTLAFLTLGPDGFAAAGGSWAVVGIAVIGLLNFGVSFACALAVAMRAQGIGTQDAVAFGWALLRGALARPLRFFLPPWNEAPAEKP